jgi:hypothetical protein
VPYPRSDHSRSGLIPLLLTGELDDFYTLLVEHWEDLDTEGADFVSIADLGKIMNSLLNDEVIDFYNPEDLEMLAADMDADGRYVTWHWGNDAKREEGRSQRI